LHDVHVTQVQLDELFALLRAVKTGEVSAAEAVERLSRSPHGVWAAIDPVTKLLLTVAVGDRTLALAQQVVHQVVQVLAPGCMPLFLTDGFKEYTTALLTHYGQWVQPARQRAQGPAPRPCTCTLRINRPCIPTSAPHRMKWATSTRCFPSQEVKGDTSQRTCGIGSVTKRLRSSTAAKAHGSSSWHEMDGECVHRLHLLEDSATALLLVACTYRCSGEGCTETILLRFHQ